MARPAPRIKTVDRPRLDIEQFKYAQDYGLVLPLLILGIEIKSDTFGGDFPALDYVFKPGRQWFKLAHEGAGSQRYYIGTPIALKTPQLAFGLKCVTAERPVDRTDNDTLDRLKDYEASLDIHLQVSCNKSWRRFEEGHFPIDLAYLRNLTAETLPIDFDDLIEWSNGFERGAGCQNRWSLTCLADVDPATFGHS